MFLLVCSASAVEEKLRNNIMKDYNKKARPVIKETDVVHIFIDIATVCSLSCNHDQELWYEICDPKNYYLT